MTDTNPMNQPVQLLVCIALTSTLADAQVIYVSFNKGQSTAHVK